MGTSLLLVIQVFFSVITGIYFLSLLLSQRGRKTALNADSKEELAKLKKMELTKLTLPLSEKTRPATVEDIVGQQQGIRALKAALCGPNPQHVIIYGPPGVGKTAAARIILKCAAKSPHSPFSANAKFIEADATTMRFDERSIADPLIGSVHDPIYQGAGAYGNAGVPQPKPGAVTKAHGGVLFIDEIGELHPIQMNRLLKVLEDRRVYFESAYYSSNDTNIPRHIHEIFQKGLPADFRLIGATTRSPEEIPEAIRSRCVEVFFEPLSAEEVEKISLGAAAKGGFDLEPQCASLISRYASNGRDAVNIVQIAGSSALIEGRHNIDVKDIEWVIEFGHYNPIIAGKRNLRSEVGVVNGLAVAGRDSGVVMEVEAAARTAPEGKGSLITTGIVDEEEFEGRGQKLKKISSAKSAATNVITVLKNLFDIDCGKYNIHMNFPGGVPVDGPSAGIAMFCAVYSAIFEKAVPCELAMTGELSIMGKVKPVGGVAAKLDAARKAGIKKVIIPEDNYQQMFEDLGMEIVRVKNIEDVISECFGKGANNKKAVS
ncbi:MAG: ATP-dependent protease LonB [Ruminococcaceae bacterium]|nr:ATP-dependent protease LonB [Oscillospiraceae bacterium]